jgi:hypothetical protein
MNPNLTQALAQQRIADMRREAAANRLAAGAGRVHGATGSGTLLRNAGRLIRSLGGRRYRQVELVWPDGVCSVVPAQSDDRPRPFAGSRQ